MENSTKAEISFKGFNEDWNISSFENLTKINQGLQIAIEHRYKEAIAGSFFYITNEFLKVGSKSKYFILNPPESVICNEDDILMTRTGNTGEVVSGVNGAFHNNFFKIKYDKAKLDKKFLICFLKSEIIQKRIIQLAGVSTIPDLNHNDFYQIKIAYPKIAQQQKIGNFFQNLDELITQHQQKSKKLKELKKAMLNKMFPKKGQTAPEIRFKGFDGDWEVEEYGNIFSYLRPDEYIVKSTEYSNKFATPVLTANKGFLLGYTNEKNTFSESCIIFDDFTLDNKLVEFPFMVKSSALKILIINKERKNDLTFMFSRLNTHKIEKMGHARHYISVVQITKVLIPIFEEQHKIGNYFKNLDTLIDNHAIQIAKLQNIKKAFLAKMFV